MTYQMYGNCGIIKIPPPIRCGYKNIINEEREYPNIFSPEVWGESFWFILHIGSLSANSKISEQDSRKYWNFIEGIPLMLPCKLCSADAQKFVDESRGRWKSICSSKESLIRFFIDFHNKVNAKQGKPLISKQDVEKLGEGQVRVSTIKYF